METALTRLGIDSLAAGGDGVGRVDGAVCFVPFTAPGDAALVRVTRRARDYLRAELVELERPGPSRREPPCPLAGRCGGCAWLHVEEAAQREAKASFLERALGRTAPPVRPSPLPLGYRRVARLHFEPGRGRGALGFVAARGRGTVDVEACPVVDPAIGRALEALRAELLAGVGSPAELRLAASRAGVAACVASARPLPASFYRAAERLVPGSLAAVTAEVDGVLAPIAGPGLVPVEGGDGEQLLVPPSGFGQANAEVNRELAGVVAGWAGQLACARGLELFAGAGNLTVALAPHVGALATGELDPAAVAAARENLAVRGLGRVAARSGDALALYGELGPGAGLVVLDPPRSGCAELARRIAAGRHDAVIYVSCDPATLGRDLRALGAGGFAVREAHGFDMFPQTAHVEAAVLLTRR